MNYLISFDYTTVRGNEFTGREGEIELAADATVEQIMEAKENIQNDIKACIQPDVEDAVFMVKITDVKPLS